MMPAALEARKPKVRVKKDRNMDQNQNHTFDIILGLIKRRIHNVSEEHFASMIGWSCLQCFHSLNYCFHLLPSCIYLFF